MIIKLKKINLFILTLIILAFFLTSLVKGDDDLNKNYNDFVKETNKIRNQLNSLPSSNSTQVSIIDSAIKEMDQAELGNETSANKLRLLTPMLKKWSAQEGVYITRESMEIMGGYRLH